MTGWPTPVPVRAAVDVPEFPSSFLPVWLRDMVDATAVAFQVPVDLPAMLVLSALAACVGGRVDVQIREGYVEPTNLYTATALPPGSRKSPVFRSLTAPIVEVERELVKASASDVARSRARSEVARKRADAAKAAASKATEPADIQRLGDEAELLEEIASETVELKPFRLLADDATPEQLATLMAEQGGRIAVLADEAAVFGQMGGRYSSNGAPNLEVYLKAHDGGTLLVDRRGREEHVENTALTIGVTVQPSVLTKLGENEEFASRGLPARFLFALPDSKIGRREIRPAPVPADVAALYAQNLTGVARRFLTRECPVSGDVVEKRVLTLSAEANAVLFEFESYVEAELGYGGRLYPVVGWGSKLIGQTMRIAGLLHIADHSALVDDTVISEEAVISAVVIADYLIDHMLAVFTLLGSTDAKEIAEKVLRKLLVSNTREFTRNALFKSVRDSKVSKSFDLEEPLKLLEDLGWIRKVDDGGSGPQGGRPKSPSFEVNPRLWGEVDAELPVDTDTGTESDEAA